jgi:hypothetical protein
MSSRTLSISPFNFFQNKDQSEIRNNKMKEVKKNKQVPSQNRIPLLRLLSAEYNDNDNDKVTNQRQGKQRQRPRQTATATTTTTTTAATKPWALR